MATRRHQPARTCVACREEGGKRELVRFVWGADGMVALDLTGRAPGRGAYLHGSRECVELARKRKAIERALGASVPAELWGTLPLSL